MTKKTSRKGKICKKWTAKEDIILKGLSSNDDFNIFAKKYGRSIGAVKQRFYGKGYSLKTNKRIFNNIDIGGMLKDSMKQQKETKNTVKPKKVVKKTTKRKKYTPRWTPEEELYLLCNFYELSVDEAKAQFNRSYGAIASQLEKIIESDKPEHIAMLHKATVIITERKKAEQKPVKLSRKERRLAKKKAKLQKRLDKMGAKV